MDYRKLLEHALELKKAADKAEAEKRYEEAYKQLVESAEILKYLADSKWMGGFDCVVGEKRFGVKMDYLDKRSELLLRAERMRDAFSMGEGVR